MAREQAPAPSAQDVAERIKKIRRRQIIGGIVGSAGLIASLITTGPIGAITALVGVVGFGTAWHGNSQVRKLEKSQ